VDSSVAQAIAREVHAGQLTRFGEPLIAHVERIARAVPDEARALAYLHDVLERSDLTVNALHGHGLTRAERSALELLTRRADQSYESYILGIVRASGAAGALARNVKLADLDDHLSHPVTTRAPDYGWARRQIARACRSEPAVTRAAPAVVAVCRPQTC
jgi:hypothetical protein